MPSEIDSVDPASANAEPPVRTLTDAMCQLEVRQQLFFLWLAVAVLVASLLLRVERQGHVVVPLLRLRLPVSCTCRRLAGHDCPGSGLTRSFISLAHGHWHQAWKYNPAGPLWFGVVLAQIPYRWLQLRRLKGGQRPVAWPIANLVVWLGVAMLLGQWLWRTAEARSVW